MKLTVRNIELADRKGVGAIPMLCDESGEPLPNQQALTITAALDDTVKIIVTFLAGEDVMIVGEGR